MRGKMGTLRLLNVPLHAWDITVMVMGMIYFVIVIYYFTGEVRDIIDECKEGFKESEKPYLTSVLEHFTLKEVRNTPFCPSQEKVHTVALRGVRNISEAP